MDVKISMGNNNNQDFSRKTGDLSSPGLHGRVRARVGTYFQKPGKVDVMGMTVKSKSRGLGLSPGCLSVSASLLLFLILKPNLRVSFCIHICVCTCVCTCICVCACIRVCARALAL